MDRAEAIVSIVIFAVVILRILIASRKASSQKKDRMNNGQAESRTQAARQTQPNKPKQGTRLAKPNKPAKGGRLAKPNKPSKGSGNAKPNKPARGETVSKPNVPKQPNEERPLEERLADYKKWKHSQDGSTQQSGRTSKQKPVEANAILDAARENTVEVELDNDLDAIETENLMERVYDVMVKGPDDSLRFQRDFVAEGMEMLNSFTLPD